MNTDLQESYRLVIDFLRSRNHLKAVDALMKSVEKLGVLIPVTPSEGLDLVSIVKNWRAAALRNRELSGLKNSVNKTVITNNPEEYTLQPKSKSISDGSLSQSKMKAGLKEKPNKGGKVHSYFKTNEPIDSSDSSSSESDLSSHSDRGEPPVKLAVPAKEKVHPRPIHLDIKRKAAPSTSSSGGSSCDSDDEKASFTNVTVAEKGNGSVRVGSRRKAVASSSPNSSTPSDSDNRGLSSVKVTAPGIVKTPSASIQAGITPKVAPPSKQQAQRKKPEKLCHHPKDIDRHSTQDHRANGQTNSQG
ncbi:hypothetical protein BS47DRAFT_1186690 [Hydnum rufescens UP504]|uniref:LisH domain-containing protein n=1 Tax=Hydnum rufescens UP504 TaxID=1448309 RepID=A0A9P6AT94_9AGAM|nr:hypothetical protein BS47DRAFT_1186690 [Hydnum rufescens UP504]